MFDGSMMAVVTREEKVFDKQFVCKESMLTQGWKDLIKQELNEGYSIQEQKLMLI